MSGRFRVFRRQSLLGAAIAWLKAFPRKRNIVTLGIGGASHATMSGTASVTARKAAESLEERVAHLEAAVAKHRQEVSEGFANAQRQLESVRSELNSRADRTDGRIAELGRKVELAAVGGFKLQGFGVLLALYGAITSVFA